MSEYDAVQLEFKDRMPYLNMLEKKWMKFSEALTNPDVTFRTNQIGIWDILTDIPDGWKDQQFENDMKRVIIIKKVDVRPVFAGRKMSIEYCEENGIVAFIEVKVIDYFALKNAMVNLWDRRQLLVRKQKIEFTTGKNLDIESIEELMAMYGEPEDEQISN